MRTRTLAELREDVRQRADLPAFGASTFVTQATVDRWINQSARRFVGMLVRAYGANYYATTHSFDTAVGQAAYDLPTDFYQLLYVRAKATTGGSTVLRRADIDRVDLEERTRHRRDIAPEYRIVGGQVHIMPTPARVLEVTIGYVPTLLVFEADGTPAQDLDADTDYLDGVNGWEEWVVLDAAIKCMQKEESDPSALLREQAEIERDITTDAQQRDQAQPAMARDTYGSDVFDRGGVW